MTGDALGNGLSETRSYTKRKQLASFSVNNGGVYSLSMGYAPDGDVQTANDSVNGNWTFSYGTFNRVATANKTGQGFSYAYDRYGNRWQQNITSGSGPAPQLTFNGNNQMAGYAYDAAGNLLNDGTHQYRYDAAGPLWCVGPNSPVWLQCNSSSLSYVYDYFGRRVAKMQNGAELEEYYYDRAGHRIIIRDGSGNFLRGEAYAGARHLATYQGWSTTYFDHADGLGTERARTNVSGAVCETVVSLPFGDGQTTSGNCGDPSPNHFTGLIRDVESGLDYTRARQYTSTLGHWITPDPGPWILDNPQSFNAYNYGLNNPLRYADDGGETAQDRVKAANSFAAQNIPYVFGGKNPCTGLDCSGLVQNAFLADPDNTIPILGTVQSAASQAIDLQKYGYYATDINSAQPGDALFFSNSKGRIVHVGIVVDIKDGRLYFVHAPHSGAGERVKKTWIYIKSGRFGIERFSGTGRPIESDTSQHPLPNQNGSHNLVPRMFTQGLLNLFFNWAETSPTVYTVCTQDSFGNGGCTYQQ